MADATAEKGKVLDSASQNFPRNTVEFCVELCKDNRLLVETVLYRISGLMLIVHLIFGAILSQLPIFDFPWYWPAAMYYITATLMFVTHWAGHRRFFLRWYKAHTISHHVHIYPRQRFLLDSFVAADDGNMKYYLPSLLAPFILTSFFGCNYYSILIIGLYILANASLVEILHSAFHRRSSWFEKFDWFQVLRFLHFNHHKGNMKTNYGISDFIWDIATGNAMLSSIA